MRTEIPLSYKFDYHDIADEERERQKAIDDWLPITSSRNAKWYYSAFHNVTAIVGAGVLSLPLCHVRARMPDLLRIKYWQINTARPEDHEQQPNIAVSPRAQPRRM